MEKIFKEFLKEVKKIRQALERIADTDEAWNAHNIEALDIEIPDEDLDKYIL